MPGLLVIFAHAGRSLAHRIAAQSTEARRHVDERSAAALEHARRGICRGSRQHWCALDRCRAHRRSAARASLGNHRRTIVGPVDGCLSSAGGCRVAWRARRACRHLRSLRSGGRRRIRARSVEPAVDSRSRRCIARIESHEPRPAGRRVRSGRTRSGRCGAANGTGAAVHDLVSPGACDRRQRHGGVAGSWRACGAQLRRRDDRDAGDSAAATLAANRHETAGGGRRHARALAWQLGSRAPPARHRHPATRYSCAR